MLNGALEYFMYRYACKHISKKRRLLFYFLSTGAVMVLLGLVFAACIIGYNAVMGNLKEGTAAKVFLWTPICIFTLEEIHAWIWWMAKIRKDPEFKD